ncbi:MAG: bifunctional phosphoribosylaminoimidazolecarboxamide formyltransferase/IMP cyclohydrolase [Defluviitaleaceae bacterium]|nr:bifunctional phosphoribosylaminoimidazolecarboxamide formyltransferase/IMP cyclohydrolase [Defluviitaleaceae bacterium]
MRRALISVSDKRGLVPFVTQLLDLDFEIISTGGTKVALEDAGLKVISIDEVTGFPEILEGRVKTLHPLVHGGLLAKRGNDHHTKQVEENKIAYIDLVCVNLYPFAQTLENLTSTHEDKIENIDIGGPSMLRSAAKNFNDVTVVVDAMDYDLVISELKTQGDTTFETRQKLAGKVFNHTASYDAMIAGYFNVVNDITVPTKLTKTYELKQTLRYGENPHQPAAFYKELGESNYSIASSIQLHGKELSYNNIADANAALEIVSEFDAPAVVAVKHMNPCGVGTGTHIDEAFQKAYDADPISIFGGIIALNRAVTEQTANKLNDIFLEIILAPDFEPAALEILQAKKNIRLLKTPMYEKDDQSQRLVSIKGGLLVQGSDSKELTDADLTTVTEVKPDVEDTKQLLFGMRVVKHVKSNAIVIVKDGMTIGIGAGQMNRVGAAKIALEQAKEQARGAYLASDAFFPMSDTVELAAEYGIKAIIQPGGSIKDEDSVKVCDSKGIAMVMTGFRHFKH